MYLQTWFGIIPQSYGKTHKVSQRTSWCLFEIYSSKFNPLKFRTWKLSYVLRWLAGIAKEKLVGKG